jgi:hypothetical protein
LSNGDRWSSIGRLLAKPTRAGNHNLVKRAKDQPLHVGVR